MNTIAAARCFASGLVKILVVEEDPEIGMMMALLLTDAGCLVEVVRNGDTAMRLEPEHGFDLIIIDLVIHGTSGFELCDRLKENVWLRDIPVLFVAGSPDDKDRRQAFVHGAADFFVKPFSPMNFVARVLSHTRIKTA